MYRNKNVVNVYETTSTTRRPARRQTEGKASSKIKARLQDRRYRHARALLRPRVLSLRGSWRPFLLSFNLTFPANGQPGVNSTALIATRQSPAVSVCERPRESEEGEERRDLTLPGFSFPDSLPPKKRLRLLHPSLRVFFDPAAALVSSATFLYSVASPAQVTRNTTEMLISTFPHQGSSYRNRNTNQLHLNF